MVLPLVGITDNKNHSSAIDLEESKNTIASKPECREGVRRKNGMNLGDFALRCGIRPSKDRKRGRKRRDSRISGEIAGSQQTGWRRMQSGANPSPPGNSLLTGKNTGNLSALCAECRAPTPRSVTFDGVKLHTDLRPARNGTGNELGTYQGINREPHFVDQGIVIFLPFALSPFGG